MANSLYISNVFHNSFVEVNEKGTEATTATTMTVLLACLEPLEDFIPDHPFMFVIKEERTGIILFVRHILNPLNSYHRSFQTGNFGSRG